MNSRTIGVSDAHVPFWDWRWGSAILWDYGSCDHAVPPREQVFGHRSSSPLFWACHPFLYIPLLYSSSMSSRSIASLQPPPLSSLSTPALATSSCKLLSPPLPPFGIMDAHLLLHSSPSTSITLRPPCDLLLRLATLQAWSCPFLVRN